VPSVAVVEYLFLGVDGSFGPPERLDLTASPEIGAYPLALTAEHPVCERHALRVLLARRRGTLAA
jgi:hypothetical protein